MTHPPPDGAEDGLELAGPDRDGQDRDGPHRDSQAARALRQRASLERAVDIAMIGTDADGRVTSWNAGAAHLLGWSAAEMIGQPIEDIFTPEDRRAGRAAEARREALAAGRAAHERWHLRKDGSRFWSRCEILPLAAPEGTAGGFVKLLRDATAQRVAEARLHETEARYRGLFEAIDVGFCVIEMRFGAAGEAEDYRIVEANPAFERLTGQVGVTGRWVSEFAPTLERHWHETYGRVARTGEPVRFENVAEAFGRWYDVRAFRIGEPGANLVAVLFNDISDRRRAEAALAASEARWRGLFERLQEGFVLAELVRDGAGRAVDWRHLEVNEAWGRLIGIPPAAVAGRTLRALFPGIGPEWAAQAAEVVATGRSATFERQIVGTGRWYEGRLHHAEGDRFVILLLEVTGRRAAEDAARRLAALVEQSSDLIGIAGPDGGLVFLNPAGRRLLGLPPEAPLGGLPLSGHFVPEQRRELEEEILPAAAEAHWMGEMSLRNRGSGADIPVLCNLFPLREARAPDDGTGGKGAFSGCGIVARDMRETRRGAAFRAALLELGDRLAGARDVADMPAVAGRAIGRTLGVSRAGYCTIEEGGEVARAHADWRAPGLPSIAGAHRMRDYGSFVEDLLDGAEVVVRDAEADPRTEGSAARLAAIQARALVNIPLMERGVLMAFAFVTQEAPRDWTAEEIAFTREVAERTRLAIGRRRAEEELRALAASLERLVAERTRERDRVWASTTDLMGTGGQDGFLKAVNPAWTRLLGWSEAELLARPFREILAPEDHAQCAEVMRRLAAGEAVPAYVSHLVGRDGARRSLTWALVADGALFHVVGRDVTEQRRIEEQLRQSQKMEAVGQLTGGIAHDFNNLLTGITGSLELMGTRIAQGRAAEAVRYVEAAQGAARRAAALTHRLLAFSRRQTLDPKPTDANRLVAGMEELVRRTVGPAIAVETRLADGLGPILVDPNQLENALLNLCINARDAMPDGGRLVIGTAAEELGPEAARARDLPPGRYVALLVADDGTGMGEEVAARAFDPFFTTKPLGQGTGLGLSMIYGFVRQSGGQASIRTAPGAGTTVTLLLPLHPGEAEAEEADRERAEAPRAAAGETVLVVDDEPTVRMLVTEVLQGLGYAALEAADGASGLEIARSARRIDLLVTDVGLPGGMNGRQLADAARALRPGLRVLFITGYAETAVLGTGPMEPGLHVMTKPFPMDRLAARIRALIEEGRPPPRS